MLGAKCALVLLLTTTGLSAAAGASSSDVPTAPEGVEAWGPWAAPLGGPPELPGIPELHCTIILLPDFDIDDCVPSLPITPPRLFWLRPLP